MSSSHSQVRPFPAPQPVPARGEASPEDVIEDAITREHADWAHRRPNVVRLAAEATAPLYRTLHGRVSELADLRSAPYLRGALRGERALTIVDMSLLALDAPEALLGTLEVLANAAGARISRDPQRRAPVHTALAKAIKEVGEATAAVAEALADGRIDQDEAARCSRELGEAVQSLEDLGLSTREATDAR